MHHLDPKQTSCFMAAAHCGTLRAAAEQLGVEPSTISRSISALETRLAATLLERGRNGVQLTQAGSVLLDYLRQQDGALEAMQSQFDALKNMQRGAISVAIGEGFVGDLFKTSLSHFSKLYPGITYQLSVGSTEQVTHLVTTGQAHLGMAYNVEPDQQIKSLAQARQPLIMLAAPNSSVVTDKTPITLAELAKLPCAILNRGYGVGAMISACEAKLGFRLHAVVETGSIAALKAFVRNDMGITILPRFVVMSELADGVLCERAIQSPGFGQGRAHLVAKNGRQLPIAAQKLASHLAQSMSAFT